VNLRIRASALLVALAVAGCASLRGADDLAGGDSLSGRLAVRVDGFEGAAPRSLSAGFELSGGPRAGRLNLSTPLGSMLAQARWAPGAVVLATPQGETSFSDLDALTREVLGESVPVAALFDWLHGRPWAGAPSTATAAPGFTQLGWVVDLARLDDAWVIARRDQPPAVTVRAKLDRP
jgi:outer membrane lipoprotein LolB